MNRELQQTLDGFKGLERERIRIEEALDYALKIEDLDTYKALSKSFDENQAGFTIQASHLARITGMSMQDAIAISNDYISGYINFNGVDQFIAA